MPFKSYETRNAYRKTHKEQINKRQRKYYQEHKIEFSAWKKKYYNEHKVEICINRKTYNKKYRNEHKEEMKKYWKDYYQKHKEKYVDYQRQYYQKNKERIKKQTQIYSQSINGRKTSMRHFTKRKRNLGWILMFDNPFDEPVEYHHITDVYVIAVPKDLHRLYYGSFHRENTMELVKQLYLGDE